MQETWVQFLGREDPWRRKWQPILVFLPGEFHGQGSPLGYSPCGHREPDMTERLTHTHTHTHTKCGVVVIVQLLSCVGLFVTPWTAACQVSLPFTISQSLLKHMSIQLVMPASLLIPCHPLLLLPSSFPSIRVLF